MKKTLKKYKGLGFVEALIALAVTGMVGIVLMNIASASLNELRILDTKDEIEFHAVSTSVTLQKLAMEYAQNELGGGNFFILSDDRCYSITQDDRIGTPFDIGATRTSFLSSVIFNPDGSESDYFRVFCVEEPAGDVRRRVLVRIIVGSTKMDGMATSKRDIKDYEYLAIIFL